jgi:hypothetical protein
MGSTSGAEVPAPEDWGWTIDIRNVRIRSWIGCGNYDEYPDDGFLCFIEPHTPTIRKLLRKIDVSAQIRALRDAIDEILAAESSIRDKRWWTYDEFMFPAKGRSRTQGT